MPLSLEISQGIIEIPIEKYKGIALCVSGGIDSATLLYIISEYITNNNLDTQLYALTVPNRTDSACGYHAQLVIDFVTRKFPVNINHTIRSTIFDGGKKNQVMNEWFRELRKMRKIQCTLNGVTANPKDSSFKFIEPKNYYIKPLPERDGNPIKYKRREGYDHYFPFATTDKKGVCEITELKNITERLLLITKSCTSDVHYHCGECWWCQERTWGFSLPRLSGLMNNSRSEKAVKLTK